MIWATLVMALREIRRNVMRSTLTTLGIVIGVAAVIAMVTLGQGATDKVTGDIAALGQNMVILSPGSRRNGPTAMSAAPLTLDDARAITRDVDAAARVAPTASRSVLTVYGNQNWNTVAAGVTEAYFDVRGLHVAQGRSFTEVELAGGAASCVLGETVRRELFGAEDALGASIRVGVVACTVVGILEPKGQTTFGMDQDDLMLMPLAAFQRRIAGSTDVSSILISAVSEKATGKVRAEVEVLMRERRRVLPGARDDFSVQDMKEIVKTVESATGVLTALLGAIAAVSLLVGGIGIMNIMLVSVTERTHEIGLRLAIGAREREVLAQFLVESAALSALGGVLGIMVGLGGSYGVARALELPFVILPSIAAIAFVFSAAVGVGFGYYPARKAARLSPIDALRHE